jgi:hypothetical protein
MIAKDGCIPNPTYMLPKILILVLYEIYIVLRERGFCF